jgi:hypothetical protein
MPSMVPQQMGAAPGNAPSQTQAQGAGAVCTALSPHARRTTLTLLHVCPETTYISGVPPCRESRADKKLLARLELTESDAGLSLTPLLAKLSCLERAPLVLLSPFPPACL